MGVGPVVAAARDRQPGSVELAILADSALTERQKHSLLDVYASFLALNERDHA